MAKLETVLRVFIASPSDLSEERQALDAVIQELNQLWGGNLGLRLDLIKWETHAYPNLGNDPQQVINDQIGDDYDIFIGILWKRFGTSTPRAQSGTEEEFKRSLAKYRSNPAGLRIMFYFKNAPVAPSEIDPKQLTLIKEFRERLGEAGGLHWSYSSVDEFTSFIRMHLSRQIQEWGRTWGGKAVTPRNIDSETEGQPPPTIELEEDGFLDLVERGVENIEGIGESLSHMTSAVKELKIMIEKRTNEVNKMASISVNIADAKKIGNRIAVDMDNFAERMETELPILGKAATMAFDSVGRAVALFPEFKVEDLSTLRSLSNRLEGFYLAISGSHDSLIQFKGTIESLPRITSRFGHAKRRVLATLDDISVKISEIMNMTQETKAVISKTIEGGKGSEFNLN